MAVGGVALVHPGIDRYGRRLRFLVLDRAHGDKLIGLIGLADPVFARAARDRWIGWDVETRTHALTNVMAWRASRTK